MSSKSCIPFHKKGNRWIGQEKMPWSCILL
jgi:hypothetical protein